MKPVAIAGVSPVPAHAVTEYYDRNTARFLRYGGSGETAAIHRRIWAPGVTSYQEAFLYLNKLAAAAIQDWDPPGTITEPARVLDLGCGAGGTTTWLAQELNLEVIGVTNSPVQLRLAQERAQALGLTGRCRFVLADFMDLPPLGPARAAVAIESFVHATDAGQFFQQAGDQLVAGGRLVICDDFLNPRSGDQQDDDERAVWLQRFREGWHIHNLLTPREALEQARQAGLRPLQATDLTAWVRTSHPLGLAILNFVGQFMQRIGSERRRDPEPEHGAGQTEGLPLRVGVDEAQSKWADAIRSNGQNLSGGSALQICIRRGWTSYQTLILEKE